MVRMMTKLATSQFFDSEAILNLEDGQGKAIFQNLAVDDQVRLVTTAKSPAHAEELIYLLPDATTLIQALPPFTVEMIIEPQLEVNPVGVMSAISKEQFTHAVDSFWWDTDNQVNTLEAIRWLHALSECPVETQDRILPDVYEFLQIIFYDKLSIAFQTESDLDETESLVTNVALAECVNLDDIEVDDDNLLSILLMVQRFDEVVFSRIVKSVLGMSDATYKSLVLQKYSERQERLGFEKSENQSNDDFILTEDEDIEL